MYGIHRDFWIYVFLSPDINNKDALELLARYITEGVFNYPYTYLEAVPSYIYITPALDRVDWQHDTVQTFFSETVCQPDFLAWLFEADSDHEYFFNVMQWAPREQIETLLHALEQMPDFAIQRYLLAKVHDLLPVAEGTCAAESLE